MNYIVKLRPDVEDLIDYVKYEYRLWGIHEVDVDDDWYHPHHYIKFAIMKDSNAPIDQLIEYLLTVKSYQVPKWMIDDGLHIGRVDMANNTMPWNNGTLIDIALASLLKTSYVHIVDLDWRSHVKAEKHMMLVNGLIYIKSLFDNVN